MRARNVKPGLFKNEILAVSDPLYTVIFEGLWCYCDREGRCEDRPGKIHMEINPGRAFETTERSIDWLEQQGFILRYQIGHARYIQVLMFRRHQNPHHREPPSTIPPPTAVQPGQETHEQSKSPGLTPDVNGLSPGNGHDEAEESPGLARGLTAVQGPSAVLIPDSGFLIPDSSPLPPSRRGANGHTAFREKTPERRLKDASLQAWREATAAIDHVRSSNPPLTWGYVRERITDPVVQAAIEGAGGCRAIADRNKFTQGALQDKFRATFERKQQPSTTESGG